MGWLSYPERVVLDVDSLMFASMNRWLVIDGTNEPVRDCPHDDRIKRFANGTGYYCCCGYGSDLFDFTCQRKGAYSVVLRDNSRHIEPILGWHANSFAPKTLLERLLRRRPSYDICT